MSRIYESPRKLRYQESPLFPLSAAAGEDAETIGQSLLEIHKRQTSDRPGFRSPGFSQVSDKALPERLHDALADIKVLTSEVAMHLDTDWRRRIFEQLDDLLDAEDWHEDDAPIKASSFETFLRMVIYHGTSRRPGFGISNSGHLIAAWTNGLDRLTLEFLAHDTIRWALSCDVGGETERAVGETPVRRLIEVLAPYGPSRWFADAPH